MSFFDELKRRNVLRVAAAYVVAAWLVIQVVETIFPAFGFGDAAIRIVVIVLTIGLAPIVILAWAFELTPEGLMLDKDVDRSRSITTRTGKKLDRIIMAVLALALGYFAFDKFVLSESREASIAETAHQEGRTEALVESYGDKSIAVLSFADMSPEGDQEYFSDGIAEELLNRLTKVPDLRVISRSSSFSFKGQNLEIPEIARRLKVAHILEGSVRKSGNRVRITAQLIEARSDTHLWSETYDRQLEDVFTIESEVAQKVVAALQIQLLDDEIEQLAKQPTANVAAYQLYLKGRYFWNKRTEENIEKALNYFQRAAELDPGFALAYTGIGDVWIFRGWYSVLLPKETFPKAKAAVVQALAFDETLAEAHTSRAHIYLEFDYDWGAAESEYLRAIELNPRYPIAHHWYGGYLSAMGRHDEALRQAYEARELSPLSLIINTWVGLRFYFAGRYEMAIEEYQKALELDPEFAPAHWHLGWAFEQTDQHAAAIASAKRAIAISGNPIYLASLGHSYAKAGDDEKARQILGQLKQVSLTQHVSAYHIAVIHAALGDTDESFEWLERAYVERSPWIGYMMVDPRLDPLRSHPGFDSLLRQAGLNF